MIAVTTWPDVAMFLIVSVPAIIAAYYGHRNASSLKTGNDKTVGAMVTDVHGAASIEDTPYTTHPTPGASAPDAGPSSSSVG